MGLEEIDYQVYGCKKCRLWQGAQHGVPGEGSASAEIMLVGQNPGEEEDKVGRPFVGRAGRFLMKTLFKNGLKRGDVYITNIVKHKTPNNRIPYNDEIEACLPYLTAQIEMIRPKKILLFGNIAHKTPRINDIEYFEIIHPQAAARFPEANKKFQEQCQNALRKADKNELPTN